MWFRCFLELRSVSISTGDLIGQEDGLEQASCMVSVDGVGIVALADKQASGARWVSRSMLRRTLAVEASAYCHHLTWERLGKRAGTIDVRREPSLIIFRMENHWHRLGMQRSDERIGLAGEVGTLRPFRGAILNGRICPKRKSVR